MAKTMNAAEIRGDWVGRVIDGRFPLLQRLGGSTAAAVFLTELSEGSRKAVIKLIPADAEDASTRAIAWDAASALSHPNLAQVHAHGRCEIDSVPLLYVVSEFADEVLAEILKERPLSLPEAREMFGPALDALSYLHSKGLVHSRLKPSNIMASGDRLKLSTDGLSLPGATQTLTGTNGVRRTGSRARAGRTGSGCVVDRSYAGGSPDPAPASLGRHGRHGTGSAGNSTAALRRSGA